MLGIAPEALDAVDKVFGAPVHELFWYCGGMQDWKNLGLTTI
jgi:hypothetical protein